MAFWKLICCVQSCDCSQHVSLWLVFFSQSSFGVVLMLNLFTADVHSNRRRLFSLSLNTALQNRRLRENVVVHEIGRAVSVRQDDTRWRLPGAKVQREVCLSSRIHYERVHRAAEAM